MSELEARDRLGLLWTIQHAIQPENAKHYEINLINRAYPSEDDSDIHVALLEAASRKY